MPPLFFLALIALLRLSRGTPEHWDYPGKGEVHPGTLYKIHRLQGDHLVAVPIHRTIDTPELTGPETIAAEEETQKAG